MKKLTLIIITLAALTLFMGSAWAAPVFDDSVFSVYITNAEYSDGDVAAYLAAHDKSYQVFDLSQTPYLFMHLPDSVTLDTFKFSWWSPNGGSSIPTYSFPDGIHDLTIAFPSATKTAGAWTVWGGYSYSVSPLDQKATGFTFAPEPLSAGLFLLGGGALGLLRRKKAA